MTPVNTLEKQKTAPKQSPANKTNKGNLFKISIIFLNYFLRIKIFFVSRLMKNKLKVIINLDISFTF